MINGFIGFDRFRSAEEAKELQELAKADNHSVILPTHVLRKDGKMVGYMSVGPVQMPCVLAWFSTKEMQARESFHLVNGIECQVAHAGGSAIMWPIPKNSPFYPLMESMGYKNSGDYTLFIKPL